MFVSANGSVGVMNIAADANIECFKTGLSLKRSAVYVAPICNDFIVTQLYC